MTEIVVVLLDDDSLAIAKRLVRTHCAIAYPEALRCLNCGRRYPCSSYELGRELLEQADWSPEQIAGLDLRTGPWF